MIGRLSSNNFARCLCTFLLLGTTVANDKREFSVKAVLGVARGEVAGSYVTELRIGRTVYLSLDYCEAAGMFGEYPAQVEGQKLVRLSAKNKVCKYRIFDTRPFLSHRQPPPARD